MRFDKLCKELENYRQEVNSRIAGLEWKVGVYRNATVTLGITTIAGAAYIGGQFLGWW